MLVVMAAPKHSPAFRLRLSLIVWGLTWIPFSLIALPFLKHFGWLRDAGSAALFILIVAGVQYAIGMAALAMAGREAYATLKATSWRRLPGQLWVMIRKG